MTNIFKVGLILCIALNLSGCDFADEAIYVLFSKKHHREMNDEHPFVIQDCSISYKGKLLPFNVPIKEWSSVLGDYERHPAGIPTAYVWDSFGLIVRVDFNTQKVSSVEWFYHRELVHSMEYMSNPSNYIDGIRGVKSRLKLEDAWPKGNFSKSIRLDGILMDKQNNIDDLNDARIKKGLSPFHRSMWGNAWVNLRNCPDMNLSFIIDPNDDDESQLDDMSFGMTWSSSR